MNRRENCSLVRLTSFVAAAMILCLAPGLWAATSTIIAFTGDTLTDGRQISEFGAAPILSNSGAIAFSSQLRRNGVLAGSGIFKASDRGDLVTQVFNEGDPAPDFNGYFSSFRSSSLFFNGNGDIALRVGFTETLGGSRDENAVFQLKMDGQLSQIVRGGERISGTEARLFSLHPRLGLNNSGHIAFKGTVDVSGQYSIFRFDGTNLIKIVERGVPVPGSNRKFYSFEAGTDSNQLLALNNSGQVCFFATDDQLVNGFYLYDLNAATNLSKLVRQNDPLPSGAGRFGFLGERSSFNDAGQIGFVSRLLAGTDLGQADNAGVFRADPAGIVQIVRKGDFLPDRNGRYLDFDESVAINNRGDVVFTAYITGASGSSLVGLFINNGTETKLIARTGGAAPGGGKFDGLGGSTAALNQSGQIAFTATLTESTGGNGGIFFYDPIWGVSPVVRAGDQLSNRGLVSAAGFEPGVGLAGLQHSGFNNRGQLAYACVAGGKLGIVLWSPAGLENNQPPVAKPGGFRIFANQGQVLQLTISNLLNVVSDPEGERLNLASVSAKTAQGVALIYNQFSQSYSYTPSPGFMGEDVFSYSVADQSGASVSVAGTISVLGVNHPPVGTNLNFTASRGETVRVKIESILAAASDPDGDSLFLAFVPTNTTRNGLVIRTQSELLITPVVGSSSARAFVRGPPTDTVACRVEDGRGGSFEVILRFTEKSDLVVDGLSRFQKPNSIVAFTLTSARATWTIERSDRPEGPWKAIGEITPDGRAALNSAVFQDVNPPPRQGFYRARK